MKLQRTRFCKFSFDRSIISIVKYRCQRYVLSANPLPWNSQEFLTVRNYVNSRRGLNSEQPRSQQRFTGSRVRRKRSLFAAVKSSTSERKTNLLTAFHYNGLRVHRLYRRRRDDVVDVQQATPNIVFCRIFSVLRARFVAQYICLRYSIPRSIATPATEACPLRLKLQRSKSVPSKRESL